MQLDATTLHQMKPDNFMSAWSCIKFDVIDDNVLSVSDNISRILPIDSAMNKAVVDYQMKND